MITLIYPVVYYGNGEEIIQVYPGASEEKNLLFAYNENPPILDSNEAKIGGIRYVSGEPD